MNMTSHQMTDHHGQVEEALQMFGFTFHKNASKTQPQSVSEVIHEEGSVTDFLIKKTLF